MVRREYLGTAQERLSHEVLKRLSEESLHANVPAKDEQAWVPMKLDAKIDDALLEEDAIFVLVESGLGKSVACHKKLSRHLAAGHYGLVLSHTVVSSSPTIEHAIEATLRQLSPALVSGAGSDALACCSQESPMLLIVEDINKSRQAAALAEKVASWDVSSTKIVSDASSTHPPSRQRWKLLCPIWPQVIAAINDVSRKIIQRAAVRCVASPELGGVVLSASSQRDNCAQKKTWFVDAGTVHAISPSGNTTDSRYNRTHARV